jgi:conjugal transfer ATP-binding protein TraC
VDADAFIRIAGEMINHNPDALYPTERELDPLKDLNYQCVDDTFDLKVKADYMTLGLRGNGRNSTARIMNFQLTKIRSWPSSGIWPTTTATFSTRNCPFRARLS